MLRKLLFSKLTDPECLPTSSLLTHTHNHNHNHNHQPSTINHQPSTMAHCLLETTQPYAIPSTVDFLHWWRDSRNHVALQQALLNALRRPIEPYTTLQPLLSSPQPCEALQLRPDASFEAVWIDEVTSSLSYRPASAQRVADNMRDAYLQELRSRNIKARVTATPVQSLIWPVNGVATRLQLPELGAQYGVLLQGQITGILSSVLKSPSELYSEQCWY